jgi:3-methyladenine DNA glycosylase AlkD
MSTQTDTFVAAVRRDLRKAAQPSRAAGMQAYLKSEMPCLGVSLPAIRQVIGSHVAEGGPGTAASWRRAVLVLWDGASVREERHAAIELARARRYGVYRVPAAIPMVERMIITGAWWDLVDPLASDVLGDILVADPARVARLMRRWAKDRDMWKRRAAIICQLRRKRDTDLALLYDCIEPNLADGEFFIRKAIGWALRQYAWTDPREVKRYVRAYRGRLSPLSVREALKNV